MSKIDLYSAKTGKKSQVAAPSVFSKEDVNMALLAQALHVYRDRNHAGSKHVKGRGDVARTTKKWYKQKGTGNARHGARSAPIFVGGGKAHGPRGPQRELSLPKKMKQKALFVALNLKNKANKVVLLSDVSTVGKTKDAAKALKAISTGRMLVVLSEKNRQAYRFVRNISDVEVVAYKDLNAYRAYLGGMLVFDNDIFAKTPAKKVATKKASEK